MRRSERLRARAAAMPKSNAVANITDIAVTKHANDIGSHDDSTKSNPDAHFRFLDLPAEIRNVIYGLATAGESRDISCFHSPAITHVSKQVRQESLEVLFTDNSFHCYVGSDLETPYIEREILPRSRMTSRVFRSHKIRHNLERYADKLVAIRTEGRALTSADGEKALFKDVTLHVLNAEIVDDVRSLQAEARQPISGGAVRLHLRIVKGKLELSVEELRDRIRHLMLQGSRYQPKIEDKDVEEGVNRATHVARELAARWGFKGYTLADVETVAWAFRYRCCPIDARLRALHKRRREEERHRREILEKEEARMALPPPKPDPSQQKPQRQRYKQTEKARRLAIAMAKGSKPQHKHDTAGSSRKEEGSLKRRHDRRQSFR